VLYSKYSEWCLKLMEVFWPISAFEIELREV
jgi:hypothetical protein